MCASRGTTHACTRTPCQQKQILMRTALHAQTTRHAERVTQPSIFLRHHHFSFFTPMPLLHCAQHAADVALSPLPLTVRVKYRYSRDANQNRHNASYGCTNGVYTAYGGDIPRTALRSVETASRETCQTPYVVDPDHVRSPPAVHTARCCGSQYVCRPHGGTRACRM